MIPIQLFSLEPGFGTSLWQYDVMFYQSVDLVLKDDFKWEDKKLSFEVFFPVIFDSNAKNIIIPGIYKNFENNMGFLTKQDYLPVYIPLLKYETGKTSFGVEQRDIKKKGSETILRGNPIFDKDIPFLTNEMFFENENTAFYISSLTHPSFLLGIYNYNTDKSVESDFLKDFHVLSLGWLDFSNRQKPENFGAATEIKTGLYRDSFWGMGFLLSGEYARSQKQEVETINTYRLSGGFWFATWDFALNMAFLYHDKNHTFGPVLTSLYPARKIEPDFQRESDFMGVMLHIGPDEAEDGLNLTAETFFLKEQIVSLYLDYALKYEDTFFYLGFARENISHKNDLKEYDNQYSFICFRLKSYLTGDIIRINWQSYYNWNNGSSLKSIISVSAFFK